MALCAAVESDFGVRSGSLTEVADLLVLRSIIKDLQRNLARWSRPRSVLTPLYLLPARGQILRQPLGVVGVISPWNYPIQLALGPAATALAAGNRVLLKPSELTPRTSALMADLIHQTFDADVFAVIPGDATVAAEFASLPFDHLFFTGSTAVGRKVAAAAAANLTPTTLELGGKSPCVIDRTADMADAALKIAHGKLLNGGQTCIAPDYVLLPAGAEEAFIAGFRQAVARLFPDGSGLQDYASIISDRHAARLHELVGEARDSGARIETIEWTATGAAPAHPRQHAPALVIDPPDHLRLMREEIFGPILPILTYADAADAVRRINRQPRPLALYWFGRDAAVRDTLLQGTVSGGVTVNDTLLHIGHERLPFGGVGESGWGAYHGETGFLRFTHCKAVLHQSRWGAAHLLYPPYGARFQRVIGMVRRLL